MNNIKVSIYIVTYRNPIDLNNNIESILASGAPAHINVINNHSQFFLDPKHESAITVLHNSLRPDFSTGHLARNWNQALLHGFRDLCNPANDIVVTVQDDVIFKRDWFNNLVDLHRRFNFITMGIGDCFCSYLPEAVKKVGIWDERFCGLSYQAGDYFLRSLIYNREGCSINDPGMMHNPLEGNVLHRPSTHPGAGTERADSLLITSPHWNSDRRADHVASLKHAALQEVLFKRKWGISASPWTVEHYRLRNSLIQNYITYPYFEKDVEGLREKNYIVADENRQGVYDDLATTLTEEGEAAHGL